MASFHNRRFKITYIKSEKVDYITTKAAAEIGSLVAEQEKSAGGDCIPPAEAATEVTEIPVKKKKSSDETVPQSDRQSIEPELNRYLQTVEADGETNPLEWWRQHEANFPQVASLTKRYLCIQATSAPSERAFSASASIITCHRSALKPERVDQLVFVIAGYTQLPDICTLVTVSFRAFGRCCDFILHCCYAPVTLCKT